MQRAFLLAVPAAALLLSPIAALHATWVPYFGVPLCKGIDYQMEPTIVADGSGGAIVAWTDYRFFSLPDIYAQRINYRGDTLWTPDGVVVCEAPNSQTAPAIASDGAGGALIVWDDRRSGSRDIFGQRIDSSGAVRWTAAGVPVCAAALDQRYPAIIADGAGGAIVAWIDYRAGASTDVYAQRIGPGGEVLWPADGIPLCAAEGAQSKVVIATDGAGGAVAAWEDRRAGEGVPRIYAQRIGAAGTVLWAPDGVGACPTSPYSVNPSIVPDGEGGAIIAWENIGSGAVPYVLTQRIAAAGNPAWGACGMAACSDAAGQTRPVMAPDGEGGAAIAWTDLRGGDAMPDIYAQRMTGGSEHLWQSSGMPVVTAAGEQSNPRIAATDGGFVIAWQDFRSGLDRDIYAQKLDGAGEPRWPENGAMVCYVADFQSSPVVASDGFGGGIVAWEDFRNRENYDIYAQRVNINGDVTRAEGPEARSGALLAQNIPNPFNPATRIPFALGRPERVSLRVFDVSGRLVRALVAGDLAAGRHEALWDGKDARGIAAASGIYFCRLEAGSTTRIIKMTLLR